MIGLVGKFRQLPASLDHVQIALVREASITQAPRAGYSGQIECCRGALSINSAIEQSANSHILRHG